MRQYFTRPRSNDDNWWEAYGPDMLARTVIEVDEEFDTGLLNEKGDPIIAKIKKPPIGFVYLRER